MSATEAGKEYRTMQGTIGKLGRWPRYLATCLLLVAACLPMLQAAETTTYVLTDDQGTVLALADHHGNVTTRFDNRPYGKQQSGPVNEGPGYTGHVNDLDTGFVYMQARYYDPELDRFLSMDTKEVEAGDTFKFNRYAYANNEPVSKFDPNGMDTEVSMVFHRTDFGLGLGYYHEFVSMKDTNSSKVYIARAGPSGNYPLSNGLFNFKADQGGLFPLTGQKPMTLQAFVGPLKGSVEQNYDNKTLLGSTVVLKTDFSIIVNKAAGIANAVNGSNIPYRAQTTNSNAFTNTVYQALTGASPPQQDLADGAATKLPINGCNTSNGCVNEK